MPAELITHRREQLVGKVRLAAGTESFIERCTQHVSRHGLVDSSFDRPAPSPESETRPSNFLRVGSWIRAAAVKSSSQEAITLPRRHTSAMSGRLRSN